ncbi:penicillin acylase family protein [Nocardioides panacisoli]|uniref:penicillin acylase family protein n=1 Tax=Nocardioides panacisoli TaxID=627624 RepID=UPI001C62F43D|nr:penicillin acylase family protein [Nocardioides panacisoli]QYJ05107.1 penicillin acylase family protein [Nocardioides panacisoli]
MITRNEHGIPWIRADSLTAVAREQGRAIARDRAWQLDLERRRGEGRVAELLGPAAVEWDTFARRAALADTARRAHDGLAEEPQAFVAAYAEGVNDAIAEGVVAPELDALGVAPGTWQPWTPLAVFWVQHVMFGSFPSKLWRHHVRSVVGDDPLRLLRHEGLLGGSNAFVLGGGRTATGMPLVAGDPHRVIEDPGIYAQVRLTCTDPDDAFDVVGLAFAGVPGVQHFGHAGDVAWAITNAVADTHDLYVEAGEPMREHAEEIAVAGAAPVRITVARTDRGPIVVDRRGERLSLRTPADVLGDLGAAAFPALLRARSVADVESAFAAWVDPVNNVLAADRSGGAAHFVAGRVPDRGRSLRRAPRAGEGGHGWHGWVDTLPHRTVGPEEAAVTANQRSGPGYEVLGEEFAPPFRADRIEALLRAGTHTAAGAAAVLGDVRQNAADRLLELVGDLTALPAEAMLLRRRLLDWNRQMTAVSRDAAAYVALREAVVRRVCEAPALAGLAGGSPYGQMYAAWFDLAGRVQLALPTILAAERPFGLDLPAVVRDAVVEVAEDVPPPPWGERHRFHALHGTAQVGLEGPPGPATPMPGDTECVLAAASAPGSGVTARGPVARYVWDLADRDRSRWAVPLGASGLRADPHHADQHDTWAAGGTFPITWPDTEEEP